MTDHLLHVGRSDATYDTAERAAAEYVDDRTPDERRFEDRSRAVSELAKRARLLTAEPYTWATEANRIQAVSNIVSDMERELQALRIMGPPSRPLQAPQQIAVLPVRVEADRTLKLAKLEDVNAKGDAA